MGATTSRPHTPRASRAIPSERWLPPAVPSLPLPLPLSPFPLPCASPCHAGHCDGSLGVCVCLPGWRGATCDLPYLPACAASPTLSLALPCEGFAPAALLPCACRAQCLAARVGVAALRRRACVAAAGGVWAAAEATPPQGFTRREGGARRHAPFKGAVELLAGEGATVPAPLEACPGACSGNGVCVATRRCPAAAGEEGGREGGACEGARRCACHAGYSGADCAHASAAPCLHGCRGAGACVAGMCLCAAGRWGLDCSLSASPPPPASPSASPPFLYVYPLSSELEGGGLHHLYQGGANNDPAGGASGWAARGVFSADRRFLALLHAANATVARPDAAALFLVPLLLTQKDGNLHPPHDYLGALVAHLAAAHPYWRRHGGADHVFFTTQDLGGCQIHPSLSRAIVVSHFGFVEALPFWMSARRWAAAVGGWAAADEPMRSRRGPLPSATRRWRVGEACRGSLTAQAAGGVCVDPFLDHSPVPLYTYEHTLSSLLLQPRGVYAHSWNGPSAWRGVCFNASKDVVAPVDFAMSPAELRRTRLDARLLLSRRADACDGLRRPHLLFMAGRKAHQVAFYSQRVRQEVHARHAAAPGVVFRTGKWRLREMRSSRFCLCPSGWGFGWRLHLALAALCVPVIIQPLVRQAYDDLLPYDAFALSLNASAVAWLPQILRAVPRHTECALRRGGAAWYRTLMWQQPDGLAYEMLMLSLCRRAVALRRHLHPHESSPPAWAACANRTAAQILADHPPPDD
ncbi:hypothetical protein AB1Y20_022755 [Prymnesium parvum]|uniref:EGF-like domain-containing protein n=1 Tax=Prymnesium parvum TaxID=97485 RepID=A0AB34JH44_PRYPA